MSLPAYVRQLIGHVSFTGGRLVVSDDPKGVIGDVLHAAVTGTDRSTEQLLGARSA